MGLRETMREQGDFFFRRRNYLPLVLIPLVLIALRKSEGLERAFGTNVDNIWEIFVRRRKT